MTIGYGAIPANMTRMRKGLLFAVVGCTLVYFGILLSGADPWQLAVGGISFTTSSAIVFLSFESLGEK